MPEAKDASPMPAPSASRIAEDQVEAHEDRIQRLETSHSSVAAQVAAQTIQITHLSTTVERLGETMETSIERLTDKLESFAKVLTDKTDQHQNQIRDLQSAQERQSSHWKAVGSVAKWPAVLIVGGLLTKFGEHLLTLFVGR